MVSSFDKTEGVRREKEARERAAEERQLQGLYRSHKDRELKARWAAEEEAIVGALEARKKEAEKHEKLVQKVSEESEELRELKEKLRAAEVNFERKLQQEEKLMIDERNGQYDAALDSLMEHNRVKAVFQEEQQQLAKRATRSKARVVLEEQMQEKVQQQAEAAAEYAKERAHVDAIVARIKEEDDAEARRKAQKVLETKEWVGKFLAMREDLREAERRRLREEEEEIARFAAEIARRQQEAEGLAAAKQEEADRILARLSAEKEENDRRREEMEELINRLYFEEQEEKHRQAEANKRAAAEASRLEMMQANEYQRALKAQRKEQEMAEEEEFSRRMLEKFAEDDRVEQMNAQRRRMKMAEHKREVERLAAVKTAMYEEQMSREMEEQEGRIKQEEFKAQIVEMERQRLLAEHAARLKDYLPKGVIAVPADLELINTISSQLGNVTLGMGGARAGTRAAGSAAYAM